MKINKRYLAIFEWSLAIILVILCVKYSFLSYGSFTPLGAHQASEKTLYYGPSKIVETVNLDGGKIYLCRYKNWISADTVRKGILKWYIGDGCGGFLIDFSKPIFYSWSSSRVRDDKSVMKCFGIVNDSRIDKVVLTVEENEKYKDLSYDLNKDRMFIFYWYQNEHKYLGKGIKGLDKAGKVIYKTDAVF